MHKALWKQLFLLILLFLGAKYAVTFASAQTSVMQVAVDFGAAYNTPSMTGFLHSLDSPIPTSMLSPLKPAWWRLSASNTYAYQKAIALGARVELVLSDSYGYPLNNWNGNGPPWENNWQNWENHVRNLARSYKGANVYWDVWNEPDQRDWNKTTFWNGTQAQFFETYLRAYKVLRQELGPSAVIGGPSYANYEQDDIVRFIQYCSKNNIQANFLSWHELGTADPDIPSVARHIQYIKAVGMAYGNIGLRTIMVNETVGPQADLRPGDIVGYLYYLEKGGAGGASKSCWSAADGSNNCFNGSVDGILSPRTNLPRAAWWAYKTYADGVSSRVASLSQSPYLVALASRAPAQVLLGYFGNNSYNTASTILILHNLAAVGIRKNVATIKVERIPATGEQSLNNPILVQTLTVNVVNGVATVPVSNIKLHEAYLITVVPPAAQ